MVDIFGDMHFPRSPPLAVQPLAVANCARLVVGLGAELFHFSDTITAAYSVRNLADTVKACLVAVKLFAVQVIRA